MEKQSTRKFLKLIVALVALFLLGASALMLASCNKDEHQHSYTSSVTTPATCSNPGVETFTCSCGAAYTQIIPATNDHAWEKIKVYANSCESEGWTVYECSVCHEQKQDDWTPKLDHQYEAVETVEETCTKDGYQIMQCSYCGDRYTDDQYSSEHKATGHKWIVNDDTDADGWKEVKAANCLEANVKERTCERCGLVENKSDVEALGHHVEGMSETVDLAAALKAKNLYVCAESDLYVDVDGNKYAFECDREDCPVEVVIDEFDNTAHYIAATAHTMKASTNAEDGYVAATCDLGGVDVQKCEVCGHTEKTDTAALGHNWNTVRMDGKTPVVVCEADTGLTQTAYLNAMKNALGVQKYAEMATTLVNNYAEATSGGKGVSRYCARCGELTVANGHEYVISKLEDGKFGLNDYEKNEDGTPVVAEGVTVETMDCRYVQVCKNGCGTVLGKGQHGDIVAATCRAGGYCETCGEQVTAQLDHKYESVATILTYANSADKDQKALYDAYVKVSATETWMTPVTGSCDVAGTTVQVCTQCLLDAANGAEFTWNTASVNLDASNPVYNGSVVAVPASHDYEMHYYRLNATSLADEIVYEQTNCEFGFKTAYICKDCGNVYKNVPVGDDETTEVNEAENNKDLGHGYTDSNGFVLDTDGKTMTSISVADVNALQAEDNKGTHSIYAIPDYAKTNGYVAPTCVSKAIIPFVCEKCGATFTMEANTADADDNAWNYATAVEDKIVSFGTGEGEDGALNPANHAGTPYACGTHCDYKVNNQLVCSGYGDVAVTERPAKVHDTFTISYELMSTIRSYYENYTLQVARVGDELINPALTGEKDTLANHLIGLYDGTKVSECLDNTFALPTLTEYKPGTTKVDDVSKGAEYIELLVLVDEDGNMYQVKGTRNTSTTGGSGNLTFYTEDASAAGKPDGNIVGEKPTVNGDDTYFVAFTTANAGTVTAAPVSASDPTSLGLALGQKPDPVKENGKDVNVLTVNVAKSFEIEKIPTVPTKYGETNIDRVVFDLNGNTLTIDEKTANDRWSIESNVTFSDGAISVTNSASNVAAFSIADKATFTLDNVALSTTGTAVLLKPQGGDNVGGTFNLIDSTVYAGSEDQSVIAVSTNANTSSTDGLTEKNKVTINIENSNIYTYAPTAVDASDYAIDSTALLINVPADVTIEGSALVGTRQALVVRGGKAEISDSTLTVVRVPDPTDKANPGDVNQQWATGNAIPAGALVIGNDDKDTTVATSTDKGYQYKTTVILDSDVVLSVTDTSNSTAKVVIGSDFANETLENQKDTKWPAGTTDKTYANISTMPIMVYLNGGGVLSGSDISYVRTWDKGTTQLVNCGDMSGVR